MATPLLAAIKVLMKEGATGWVINLFFIGVGFFLIYKGIKEIKTKEAKFGKLGKKVRGNWAIFSGVIKLFLGVNLLLFSLLTLIFSSK